MLFELLWVSVESITKNKVDDVGKKRWIMDAVVFNTD